MGKTSAVEYSTSVAEMLAAETEPATEDDRGPWSKRMPISVHVVKRVTERDNLDLIGRTAGVYVTEYAYRDPVYEGRQREFRGFSRARATRFGDQNSPTNIAKTRFLLGECVDVDTSSTVDTCDNAHRYLDNTRDALKGLPVVTETRDEDGKYLSTNVSAYTLRHLYTGMNSRAVRHAFNHSVTKYVYDVNPFAPAFSSIVSPVVVVEGASEPGESQPVVRRGVGPSQLRVQHFVDAFGNKTRTSNAGCESGCQPGPDEVIDTYTDPARPPGDGSRWIWRTVRSYVQGSSHPGSRNETRRTYNDRGDPVDTFVTLSGSLALDRTNVAEVATAPNPVDASVDRDFETVHRDYDTTGLGTLIREVGTNGHCTDINYDDKFKQFPTSETVYVGGSPPFTEGQCGPRQLVTGAAYDRGIGKPTTVVDANLQSTILYYDSFGRIYIIARTPPDGSLPTITNPTTTFLYTLADKNGKPFSAVRTSTRDGSTPGGFLETWTFIDGFGRQLAALNESEIQNKWIVSDFSLYDGKGALSRKHLECFWTGGITVNTSTPAFLSTPPLASPTCPPPPAGPPAPSYATVRYDAFGREVERTDFDTTPILKTKYHSLSKDLLDAADQDPGNNTFATEQQDGHGRVIATTERIRVNSALELRHVRTSYLPTGEPEVITRERGTDQVVRWMRYDSLGRMVLNAEPNTTSDFDSNPNVGVPQVTSNSPHATADIFDVAYGGGKFVAVGAFGGVWTSTTGGSWTHVSLGGHLYAVTYCNNHFTVVGTSGVLGRSTDGTNWTWLNSGVSSILWDVACDPSNFNEVAVGVNGKITASTNGGLNWTVQTSNVTSHLNAVAASSGTRIAVGDGGVILRSTNGTTWSQVTSGTTAPLTGVVRGGDRWIAVGPLGTVLRSTDDGASFSPTCASCAAVGGTIQGEGAALTEVVYLSQTGRFLASAGHGKIWYSDDGGTSWTKVINDPIVTGSTHYYGIAIGGSTIVVVGLEGRATSSTDGGLTWTNTSATRIRPWRYAYNDAGDLVGTSDSRGCGVNFFYEAGGRLLGEDYSPCEAEPIQVPYSAADPAAGTGLEVYYQYDDANLPSGAGLSPPPATGTDGDPNYAPGYSKGRLVSVHDRGSSRWSAFDARGRVTLNAVRIARPDAPPNGFTDRYAPRWYYRSTAYDILDREIHATTGAKVADLLGTPVTSVGTDPYQRSIVSTTYTARGTVKDVTGSYGTLVSSITRAADGLIAEIAYGDAATTTTHFNYDQRRRVIAIQTERNPPPSLWSSPPTNYLPPPDSSPTNPTTFQILLQDETIEYDVVSNPVRIDDWRLPEHWPAGAKPVDWEFTYDDLYRLTSVDYTYDAADDAWKSPFEAENDGLEDPRRAEPSPHVAFTHRTLQQTFQYDWLGNTSRTDDDAGGFYDRSLGPITNGTPNAQPYQLKSADNSSVPGATSTGQLSTAYDAAGNLTRLSVQRNGTCMPDNADCSQRFAYDWDEVGRLVRARRWDLAAAALQPASAPLPPSSDPPEADLRNVYDAGDMRVVKIAKDSVGAESHTVYIFGSLELRRAAFTGGDYERNQWTEVPYLLANVCG